VPGNSPQLPVRVLSGSGPGAIYSVSSVGLPVDCQACCSVDLLPKVFVLRQVLVLLGESGTDWESPGEMFSGSEAESRAEQTDHCEPHQNLTTAIPTPEQ
jgi:hypothetical protein